MLQAIAPHSQDFELRSGARAVGSSSYFMFLSLQLSCAKHLTCEELGLAL